MTTTIIVLLSIYLVFRFIKWIVFLPVDLWTHFLAIMNLMRVRDLGKLGLGPGLPKWGERAGQYLLIRGYIQDFLVNVIHVSILLKEWPRLPKLSRRKNYPTTIKWLLKDGELTVSERIARHANDPTSPHQELCKVLRAYWLSIYDLSGKHG